jgi:hypothetical protein
MGLRIWICREKGEVLILLFEFMIMHSMALQGVLLWDMGYGIWDMGTVSNSVCM